MRKNLAIKLMATVLATVFVVAACGGGSTPTVDPTTAPPTQADGTTQPPSPEATTSPQVVPDEASPLAEMWRLLELFPQVMPNDNPPLEGGILRHGWIGAGGFAGMWNPIFWTTADDSNILAMIIVAVRA